MDDKHNQIDKNKNADIIVVGIGASAGGLEALQDFFKSMPLDTGLAFVVVQHLSPDYKSLMDELLARYTKLKIKKIEDGIELEPNTIFLIPPAKNITIFHNKLYLEDQNLTKGLNLPIDKFLRSLAAEKGKNAIGIILSGTGSDGTLGTRAIKEVGGMVMVQDVQSAKFDGMPRSSISTGLVDYILHPAQMPDELITFLKHPFIEKPKLIDKLISKDIDTLSKILLILRESSTIDFSYYKENTVIRRLERRVSINRCSTLEEYLKLLSESEKERNTLYRELLIGVTRFFRDNDAYEQLEKMTLPEIFSDTTRKNVRLWSVACSTGEEAYSLAIIISEYMDKHKINCEVKIFATDIDKFAIESASIGYYPDSIVADIEPSLLSKYFIRKENGYQVGENLRRMVVFATHNILKDPPFSKMDLISCRNLFIYFKPEIQTKVLSMFYFSLNINGFLFMGSSETIGELSQAFSVVDSKHKIYKYKKGYKSPILNEIEIPFRKSEYSDYPINTYKVKYLDAFKMDRLSENLLNLFMPPSIIINENSEIIQIINDVNPFIKIPTGRFSFSLFNLVNDELKIVITSILRQLKSENNYVIFEDIYHKVGTSEEVINLEGRILTDDRNKINYYLLTFYTVKNKQEAKTKIKKLKINEQLGASLTELEKELQFTKESLQATVEELETSNEELQSSNEELIASNEELQSTNEELQSVNEELYTVYSEFQNKIEELTALNNDMNNLVRNTNVGTLYLDRKLCIRKFTPSISKITNIMEMDIGRPVYHIAVSEVYKEFIEDVNEVLDTLMIKEREIKDKENYYLVRLMPYRTQDNAIDGIIITFVEINSLKAAEKKSAEIKLILESAMEAGLMAWWEWDYETGIVKYDPKKATMLGYTVEEFPKKVYDICALIHPDDYESAMQAMRDALEGKKAYYETIYRIKTKDNDYKWYLDKGGVIREEDKIKKVIGIVIDISEQKKFEAESIRNYELIIKILENSPLAKTMVDKFGHITYANKKAEEIFSLTKLQISERTYDDVKWKIIDLQGNVMPSESLPFFIIKKTKKSIYNFKHYIQFENGIKKLLVINGAPILSTNGEFDGAVFTIQEE